MALESATEPENPLNNPHVKRWRQTMRCVCARWVWIDVAIPLLLTRLALMAVGWFSQYLPVSKIYPAQASAEQGWAFTPHRLLDIWARWDTGWLISIVAQGYSVRGDLSSVQSNIAFFPLYPYLSRVIIFALPEAWQRMSVLVLIGVVLSNLFLFGAMAALYRMVMDFFRDEAVARRAVLYVLVFPTSFVLSSFLTEGAFLFFVILAFYAALKRAWWAAGVCGCCAALTRHLGVVIFAPLAWMYLESVQWNIRKIRWSALWLLLVPAGTFAYLLSIYPITGSLFAPFQAHGNWGRHLGGASWISVLHQANFSPGITPIDQALFIIFLLCAVASLFLLPSMAFGLLTLILIALPPSTGTLSGFGRFCSVMFPAFIVLAWLGKRFAFLDKTILIFSLVLQALFMMLWCQFYPVVN